MNLETIRGFWPIVATFLGIAVYGVQAEFRIQVLEERHVDMKTRIQNEEKRSGSVETTLARVEQHTEDIAKTVHRMQEDLSAILRKNQGGGTLFRP